MEFKFSKDGEKNLRPEPAVEKKNQNALLVLLLLLVGGFSYVYFFTGMIKSQDAPKPAEAPASLVVKAPLPPREGDVNKVDSKLPDLKKETAPPPEAEPHKNAVPAPSAEKKIVTAVKKPEPAKTDVKKPPKVALAKPKTSPKPLKPSNGTVTSKEVAGAWSIVVGTYVLEDALSTDMGRLRKAGFVPVVKPGASKKADMSRLFLSEFADRSVAEAAYKKLTRHTSDAFIVDEEDRHSVYAGSYLLESNAASEMERLSGAGFPVSLKRVQVSVPSRSLTLGPFKNKKAADAALEKLKAAGIKGTISH